MLSRKNIVNKLEHLAAGVVAPCDGNSGRTTRSRAWPKPKVPRQADDDGSLYLGTGPRSFLLNGDVGER
jgi:hypothetical protein